MSVSERGNPESSVEDDLAPLRRFRSPALVFLGCAGAAAAVLLGLFNISGVAYFTRSRRPRELGRIEQALASGRLLANEHVSFTGLPLVLSEARLSKGGYGSGCVSGQKGNRYFFLLAETGNQVVISTRSSRKARGIPGRERYAGRLVRFSDVAASFRLYRRLVYRLSDCTRYPESCDRGLVADVTFPLEEILPYLGRAEATLKGADGTRVFCKSYTPLYVFLRYKDEYEYTVTAKSKDDASARVKSLQLPHVFVGPEADRYRFVIRAPSEAAQKLVRAQRRTSDYTIAARLETVLARFGDLSVREGTGVWAGAKVLAISHPKGDLPVEYRLFPSSGQGDPGSLRPVSGRKDVMEQPLGRVESIRYSGHRNIPEHAYLLVEGLSPGEAWPSVLLMVVALLLLAGGGACVGIGLRRPSKRAGLIVEVCW